MIIARLHNIIASHEESAGKKPAEIVLCEEWMAELLDYFDRQKMEKGKTLEFEGVPTRVVNDSDHGAFGNFSFRAITKR